MEETIFSYKCPSCDAALHYDGTSETMFCEFCGSHFDVATVKAYNDRPRESEATEADAAKVSRHLSIRKLSFPCVVRMFVSIISIKR